MSAPVLRWAKRDSAPPPPSWIPVHCQQAKAEKPEHVCLLGDYEQLSVHFVRQTRQQRGRSEPCLLRVNERGECVTQCPYCEAGDRLQTNFYAPALIHTPGDVVKGKEVWRRVVYYVPPSSIEAMAGAKNRGKQFACWREQVGSVSCFRSRFIGYVADLAEPSFDVRPIVQHVFHQDQESASAVKLILESLPPVITPPRSHKPNNPETTPISKEEQELVRKKLAEFRAKTTAEAKTTKEDILTLTTGEIISRELRDQLPDGHPAKKPAPKRKGGAA